MDKSQLSGFSQVVSLGRRGKRSIYRALDEHDDEVVLMLFDSENNEDSENRKFQWLGEQLASKPIRHFVSLVRWENYEGQRLVAFKVPQGTELPRITSDANGISAEFGFLLIKALIQYCSDHHEIGLNLGELNIDQIVITRQGPIVIPDFEFYLNQISESPDYDSELDVYWSNPGLRHRNNYEDIANLGSVITFLVSQIHDKDSLNSLFSNGSNQLDSFLETVISKMLNENPLLRPSALSLVDEFKTYVPQRKDVPISQIKTIREEDALGADEFESFRKIGRNLAMNFQSRWADKRQRITFVGISLSLCVVAIVIAAFLNHRDTNTERNVPSTENAAEVSVTMPLENTIIPETSIVESQLELAKANWYFLKQDFLWSFSLEPIAVGNAVYAIASNQDLFPETAPADKYTNMVLAQWTGQSWVAIQNTALKNDAPGLLNMMSSPSGEPIFLYTRCCVGHPTEALQTVPVNRVLTIRKGQLYDLLNDENLVATNRPAYDVSFRENSLTGSICVDAPSSSSDFGPAGSCTRTRQITVYLNSDGSERIEQQDLTHEVATPIPSVPVNTNLEEFSCNGSWITIVAAVTEETAQIGVDQNPGSQSLAATTCPSLTQKFSSGPFTGQVIYLIVYGPYFDHQSGSTKCRELGKETKSECYVKSLSNNPADGNVGYGPND